MADGGVEVPPQEDVKEGQEPGATRNSLLVLTDSEEDLAYCLEHQCNTSPRRRLPSGTIKQITKFGDNVPDGHITQGDSTSVDSLGISSRDSSARATPSAEVHAQESADKLEKVPEPECNHVDSSVNTPSSETADQSTASYDGANQSASSCDVSHDQSSVSVSGAGNQSASLEDLEEEEVDFVHTAEWRNQKKHIFILSEAGKPIYSRHGKEDKIVTITGVMQALVSVVTANKDLIRCIVAGQHKFVFLVRDHLILVAAVATTESMHQIHLQLNYVYNQVLSVLTFSQLARIFKQRRNYDLRRLLTGAEKFLDNLITMMECDPSFLLAGIRCLPLESSIRDTIAQSIVQNAKVKDLVFAILVAENQLITLVRMKRYYLHPIDLHLVFNLVSASESFKSAESWTPICLPKFDSGGYLHAHISYLDEECKVCLLLLTVDRDMFFTLSDCKHKIQQRLIKYKCLNAIAASLKQIKYTISQVGIPDLRHFIYKSRSAAQFTSPAYTAPYHTTEEQERLFSLYQYLHRRIHSTSRPLKILFHVGQHETLLGWVTSGFELYAVFGPLVTKPVAINSVNKLLKWVKKEEDRLFIMSSPTF